MNIKAFINLQFTLSNFVYDYTLSVDYNQQSGTGIQTHSVMCRTPEIKYEVQQEGH